MFPSLKAFIRQNFGHALTCTRSQPYDSGTVAIAISNQPTFSSLHRATPKSSTSASPNKPRSIHRKH